MWGVAHMVGNAAANVLKVRRHNFHGEVIPMGFVSDLTADEIEKFGRIDLFISGSPCADLSLINPERRGLIGKNSPRIFSFCLFHYLHDCI